jgi:hypothetical protein
MNIQKLINTMENDTAKAMQSISAKVLKSVVKKTPVDLGCAKNNWNLSEGKMDASTSYCKRDPSININVLKKISGKKDIYITNSLAYIMTLEKGHSKQAPKGMVATTVNELKNL